LDLSAHEAPGHTLKNKVSQRGNNHFGFAKEPFSDQFHFPETFSS